MDPYAAIPRIFLALFLGAIIGLEREFTQKSAGLRTHILVTLGATIFTIVSFSDFYNGLPNDQLSSAFIAYHNRITQDPTRVAAQIVTGIGFIGGGAVLRYGATVRGLTTAASLWTMASIGMLVGLGQYRLSVVATLLTFLVLFTIGKLERHFFTKSARTFNRLRVSLVATANEASGIQLWMEEHFKGIVLEAKIRSDHKSDAVDMTYKLNMDRGHLTVNEVSRQISLHQGVRSSSVRAYYETEDIS
jgi:putative Mg2+ transporter-C (MgtC) family protein